MKKYFTIYQRILQMTLAVILEYRFNIILHGAFSLFYFVGLYFLIFVMFTQTTTLGGWTKAELLVLLTVANFSWGWIETVYFQAMRKFMISGVKNGDLDMILTKPVNTPWYVGLSSPDITFSVHQIIMTIFLAYAILSLEIYRQPLNLMLFAIALVMSFMIIFLVFSSYSTLAFYIINSSQTLRTLQTFADHSHYPTVIYPQSVQNLMYTFLPVAFVGYVPTTFLLGKSSSKLFLFMVIMLLSSAIIHKLAWHYGLRRYSSASS